MTDRKSEPIFHKSKSWAGSNPNTRLVLLVAAIMACSGLCSTLKANSLWLNGRDLYSSRGAREYAPGDIVTVKITEEASAQSAATTNSTNDSSMEVQTGPSIPIFQPVFDRLTGNNEVRNNWRGNGTTTRTGRLAGTVTTSVQEVLSNGNLLLEGSRLIQVNGETQVMKVRGVARPRDIDVKNTVNSTLLADAQITFQGKGSVGETQRPGIMTRILRKIF